MYQDDAFYDACDALGILIYHDAMFCERLYPHTPAFTASVVAELEDQVARVGHHPSIALWDANNENDGDPRFFYDVVLTTLARADGTRPLWPSSPSSGFATGVATKTGLPNGNPLTGRFNTELDTHMPYNYCNESFVTSTQLDQPTSVSFRAAIASLSPSRLAEQCLLVCLRTACPQPAASTQSPEPICFPRSRRRCDFNASLSEGASAARYVIFY